MDLDAYVTERAGEWRRLETLVSRRRRSAAEADELVMLYQRAATHLSVVRTHAPDPVVLANLSRVVLAGRAAITGGRRYSWRPIGHFFTTALPGELYRTRRWWLGLGVLLTALATALMQYVAAHPEVAALFLDQRQIQQLVQEDFVNYYSTYQPQNFAAQVWTNNALVAAQCLASGVLILPVFYVLGQNLLNFGVTGGVMMDAGRSDVFLTMIAPHGLLELTCIFVSAGVGLRIGWSWIAPGARLTRGQALAQRARSGMVVAIGLAIVLGVAGLLEAYVTPAPLPAYLRIAVGALAWLAFLGYALVVGAAAHARAGTADLAAEHRPAELPVS